MELPLLEAGYDIVSGYATPHPTSGVAPPTTDQDVSTDFEEMQIKLSAEGGEMLVGRSRKECDFVFRHDRGNRHLSRIHAKLSYHAANKQLTVTCLGQNGLCLYQGPATFTLAEKDTVTVDMSDEGCVLDILGIKATISKPHDVVVATTTAALLTPLKTSSPLHFDSSQQQAPPPPPSSPLSSPSRPCVSLDLQQLAEKVAVALVFSCVSATPLAQLAVTCFPQDASEAQVADTLKQLPFVGEVQRHGKDAAGRPLASEYYYQPEGDWDLERRERFEPFLRPTRNCRKTHKQVRFTR